jgi:hypothetical protein
MQGITVIVWLETTVEIKSVRQIVQEIQVLDKWTELAFRLSLEHHLRYNRG